MNKLPDEIINTIAGFNRDKLLRTQLMIVQKSKPIQKNEKYDLVVQELFKAIKHYAENYPDAKYCLISMKNDRNISKYIYIKLIENGITVRKYNQRYYGFGHPRIIDMTICDPTIIKTYFTIDFTAKYIYYLSWDDNLHCENINGDDSDDSQSNNN